MLKGHELMLFQEELSSSLEQQTSVSGMANIYKPCGMMLDPANPLLP